MEEWKRNLAVLYAVQFLAMASISCVTPFLPLYLQQLGLSDPAEVRLWSGLVFAANLVTAFLFSLLWGKLGDRYGRKAMLVRAGVGMAVTITLMSFVTTPGQLLALRLLNGALSGFGPAATALVAANTEPSRSGYAQGVLHSGAVGGTICGPLIGGALADMFGFSAVFACLGAGMMLAALLTVVFVTDRSARQRTPERTTFRQDARAIFASKPLPSLFLSAFFIRTAMVGTLPLIPLYVQQLSPDQGNLAFWAGFAAAVTGMANMAFAPRLGQWGDKHGPHKVLFYSLAGAALFTAAQAFAQTLWQFMALRFCTGVFLGGLTPSIQTMVRRYAPEGMLSRTFSYSNCALILGGLAGSAFMSMLAAAADLSVIFIAAACLLLINMWGAGRLFRHMRR